MKRKFLSLILAISIIPAPIASYAKDDNKCKEDLELCYDQLNKSINLLTKTNFIKNNCLGALNTSRRDNEALTNTSTKCLDALKNQKNYTTQCLDTLKVYKNHSDKCLEIVEGSHAEILIYRAVLLLIFGPKIVRFVRNFRF